MQQLTSALANHLAQEVTTLATCWSLTRRDGVSLYFTEHDQDVVVDGNRYMASSGMSASAVTSQAGLTVDNLEFEGMLDAAVISEADILSIKFDQVTVSA
jgi:uncharacterized phage protein (TIGR02218 family)